MHYRPDRASWLTRAGAIAGLAFMHIPVLVIILYAFTTEDRTYQFPPPGLTLHWFSVAFARADIWQSLSLSLAVAACATTLALVFGTLAAFALARARFPAKNALTVLFVLPIALPGIITGIALLAAMKLGRVDASELHGGQKRDASDDARERDGQHKENGECIPGGKARARQRERRQGSEHERERGRAGSNGERKRQ